MPTLYFAITCRVPNMKQLLIIQLILYFGWLSCIAVAQLEISSAITGSASFPHVGITCLGNLAIFITSFIRKRLDLEMGARDFLATFTGPCKFKEIHEPEKKNENGELIAVTQGNILEASVVMLSNSAGMTNSCVRQFMEYMYNAHLVHSVLLKYDIPKDANVPDSRCNTHEYDKHSCNCIEIRKVKGINMPQVLKVKSDRVLLPSQKCLDNECHGKKGDLLHLENNLLDNLNVEFSSAVFDALDFQFTSRPTQRDAVCICIPVNNDKWTKLLVRSLKYKDQGDKGSIVAAADALQSYLDNRGKDTADTAEEIKYRTVSLIVIRLVEIFVNLLLTVFFKVDGFSSALAARRAVRSYVVDSKGSGLPANVFITSGLVVVKSDSVCQVLKFRGSRTVLVIVGCVNLLCAIAWALVLIAFNGGVGKWYAVSSMPPSKPRVAVIIAAICIATGMDIFEILKKLRKETSKEISKKIKEKNTLMILGVITLELAFAVVAAAALGLNKGIGRWVYGALQLLVWFKWGIGSAILGAYSPEYVSTSAERGKDNDGRVILKYSSANWVDEGTMVYCSSFFLNSVMVGVMGDWAGIWSTWK